MKFEEFNRFRKTVLKNQIVLKKEYEDLEESETDQDEDITNKSTNEIAFKSDKIKLEILPEFEDHPESFVKEADESFNASHVNDSFDDFFGVKSENVFVKEEHSREPSVKSEGIDDGWQDDVDWENDL